jgi:hypothetical protein
LVWLFQCATGQGRNRREKRKTASQAVKMSWVGRWGGRKEEKQKMGGENKKSEGGMKERLEPTKESGSQEGVL